MERSFLGQSSDPQILSELSQDSLVKLYEILLDLSIVSIGFAVGHASREKSLSRHHLLLNAKPASLDKLLRDPRTAAIALKVQRELIHFADKDSLDSNTWDLLFLPLEPIFFGLAIIEKKAIVGTLSFDKYGSISLPGLSCLAATTRHAGYANSRVDELGRLQIDGISVELAPKAMCCGFEVVGMREEILEPLYSENSFPAAANLQINEWIITLSRALELIRMHPPSWDLVSEFGKVIVPVASAGENVHSSISYASIPRALYMSWSPLPRIIAEAMVHESDHQHFYANTLLGPQIWLDESGESLEIFRSPWRSDPRPLGGLIRGASAFIAVGTFWNYLKDSYRNIGDDSFIPGLYALQCLEQSIDALDLIKRFGKMTNEGTKMLHAMTERASVALSDLESCPDFSDWKILSEKTQSEHRQIWLKQHGGHDRCMNKSDGLAVRVNSSDL